MKKSFKAIQIILSFTIILMTFSCSEKEYTAEDIYTEFSPAVVLIMHEFYYEAKLNDISIYFVQSPKGTGFLSIAESEQEAIENSMISSGTGFFINNDGIIATNSHVAFPLPNELEQSNINDYFGGLKLRLIRSQNELKDEKNELEDIYYKKYDQLTFEDVNLIRSRLKEITDEITELSNVISLLNYDKYDIEIVTKTVSIKIGYNDTHIEDSNDLIECVKLVKSQNKDLALIQLKSKKTPSDITPIMVDNLDEVSSLDDKVYMVGYNSGMTLAQTSDGVQSQITSGNITQKSDGEHVLYSIPTLSGSSGSPVINDRGQLVGVNYAKLVESQGFSFGVPVAHLVELVKEEGITTSKNRKKNKRKKVSHSNKKAKFKPNGIINGTKVNVRPQANTKNTPLDFTLENNQKVIILEYVDNANKEFLLSEEVDCNVDGKMITLNKGKAVTLLDCNVNSGICSVRFFDGSGYLTGLIPEESINEVEGLWYKIQTEEGKIGWVYGEYLKKLNNLTFKEIH